MWTLRIGLLFSVVYAAATILNHGLWKGRYKSVQTWSIQLEPSPVWNPPSIPTYEQFHSQFDALPKNQAQGTSLTRILKWDWMVVDFLVYFWGITTGVSVVYLGIRAKRRDPVLQFTLWIAAGLTGSAVTCVLLWGVIGGWGPPWPLLFGVVGLILGPIIGAKRYSRISN